jgi:hypothetical protein
LSEQTIEVYSNPVTDTQTYQQKQVFTAADQVQVEIDGKTISSFVGRDLLP